MLTPKHYQQTALEALRDYLALARAEGDPKKAFIYQTERPYHSVPQLPGLPYVCLRLPTGGGKTLLACHAVSIAAREFLQSERCLVLWLTPTNTIKDQTLAALNNLRHPYRQALAGTVGDVTVQALREGWDCPFAYVLCSVAELGAQTAVEQILGRILRMPKATRKQQAALNHAYAFVTSQKFTQAAQSVQGLTEALEANGFNRFEAQTEVQAIQPPLADSLGPLFAPLDAARQTPAERGQTLSVPQLAFWLDDELLPVPEGRELDFPWRLSNYDSTLSQDEFPDSAAADKAFEVDVTEQGRLTRRFVSELSEQMGLLNTGQTTTLAELVKWLDERLPNRRDISQAEAHQFLLGLLNKLMDRRGLTLEHLSRERYRLLAAATQKIKAHRDQAASAAYQQTLFGSAPSPLEVSEQRVFTFNRDLYPANELYEGASFPKHYYRAIGKLNGEEALCAQFLESLPKVKYWVRNLERQPQFSFWLPTPTDKFYPDFVALLDDDRLLVVEYKGALSKESDNRQKIAVGNLWESRSGGKCLFLFVVKEDYESKLRAVAG